MKSHADLCSASLVEVKSAGGALIGWRCPQCQRQVALVKCQLCSKAFASLAKGDADYFCSHSCRKAAGK